MRRFLLDLGALISCASFVSACYLWMGLMQAGA